MEPDHIHLLKKDCSAGLSILPAHRPLKHRIFRLLQVRTANKLDNIYTYYIFSFWINTFCKSESSIKGCVSYAPLPFQ